MEEKGGVGVTRVNGYWPLLWDRRTTELSQVCCNVLTVLNIDSSSTLKSNLLLLAIIFLLIHLTVHSKCLMCIFQLMYPKEVPKCASCEFTHLKSQGKQLQLTFLLHFLLHVLCNGSIKRKRSQFFFHLIKIDLCEVWTKGDQEWIKWSVVYMEPVSSVPPASRKGQEQSGPYCIELRN